MATIDQVGYKKITVNEEAAKEVIGYKGIVQFQPTAAGGGGRIMSSLANHGGLAGYGGIAGQGGGLAG